MKKYRLTLFVILFSTAYSRACSTCNVEFSAEEQAAFIVATGLLILMPIVGGWALFRFLKKKYH